MDNIIIVDIFRTIQGEGPHAGMAAVFVRLAGCNLQCPMCDTDYTTGAESVPCDQLPSLIRSVWLSSPSPRQSPPLVVITGGEPFRQMALRSALKSLEVLLLSGTEVIEIETNGSYSISNMHDSLPDIVRDRMSYVISPKTKYINDRYPIKQTVFKYVISADNVWSDGLPNYVLGQKQSTARPGHSDAIIYVQPQDDKDPEVNKLNRDAAIRSCLKFGYRLSLQTQKILDLP